MDFCFSCQHSILDVGGKAVKNSIDSVESKEDDLDREREDSLPRQQVNTSDAKMRGRDLKISQKTP